LPNTTYYYVVGNDREWSAEASFTTQPDRTPTTTTFAVYGDMGILNSNTTIELLTKFVDQGELDFVLHIGDISYAGTNSCLTTVIDSLKTIVNPQSTKAFGILSLTKFNLSLVEYPTWFVLVITR
jgi:hypothetical protein